jgi:hypothetical protein
MTEYYVSAEPQSETPVEIPLRRPPLPSAPAGPEQPDDVLQTGYSGYTLSGGISFDGATYNGFYPPDPNIAVGPSYILEGTNVLFTVYNKSGAFVANINPWSGFGGPCQTNQGGDIIVQYDRAADRWLVTQLANNGGPTYYFCISVSTTNSPTGSYYRWAYTFASLADYPKVAVWPTGYFASFNMFSGGVTFTGPQVCAYNRTQMLAGNASPTAICYQLSTSYASLLPSDLDGATAPPANSPNFYLSDYGSTNSLKLWKFTPNFANPPASTFTGPTSISVASFSVPCGTCVPQSGTTTKLDSLGDRMMYRLAYRNFGTYQSMVVNRSVSASGVIGIRWYEIRNPNGTPTVYQQGTYAPNAVYRWMGSIAMDKTGSIGLGYSTSTSSSHPGIAYTGHHNQDALGVMAVENTMITGTGSATSNRWGDYTAMRIDPSDDLTFWYVNEYLSSNGLSWKTRIGSFLVTPPVTCNANTSCQPPYGGQVIANITLSCSAPSNISVSATACGYSCNSSYNQGYASTLSATATAQGITSIPWSCSFSYCYNGVCH